MSLIADNAPLANELTHYCWLAYERHLVGAAGGNASVRLPHNTGFMVTASGVALRDVVPENLMVVDENNQVLENPAGLKASKEAGFHLSIFRARPHVNAVLHVHPTYATVFASLKRTIPLVTISSQLKLKQGRLVPDAPPGSTELSRLVACAAVESSPDVSVLLLERHGVVAFGNSLCAAFDDAELAEDTAHIALLLQQAQPIERLAAASSVVDLSAMLNESTPFYPTDPPFKKSWHVAFEQAGANVSRLEMGAHTGSHVDAPLHFLEGGAHIAAMSPDLFFGQAIAIDAPKEAGQTITPSDLAGADIRPGDIVLFRTGWEDRSGSPRFFEGDWPAFSAGAVEALIARQVKAIGGDIASADGPIGLSQGRPAHTTAMRAGLPIFEALVNLKQVVGRRFFFIGLPLRIEQGEASPIRAIALLQQTS